MKLSILIPMYNAERYIEKCLESLMFQSIAKDDYEVIVFDDGSSDSSLKVVKNFSKKYTNILIYTHANRGVVFTRKKLLKLAKGTYIYFVDADDFIAHNSLSVILDFALFNTLDVIGFNTVVTHHHFKTKSKTFNENKLKLKIVSGPEYLRDNKNMRIEIWWYLIRKEVLEKNNLFFDKSDYDGDVVFTMRLFLIAKKVAYAPYQVYYYFQSEESVMRSRDAISKSRIIKYFIALIKDFSILIDGLDNKNIPYKEEIKNNFKYRRDSFTFFTISKMIKANINVQEIRANIFELKLANAYPLKSFISEDYKSVKYKLLNYLFNHKRLLFTIVKFNNLFKKR
jgi:glycosyltransferase involved in cell wall biosynthesis